MTYLTYQGMLRQETDAGVIANLRRKGWVDAPTRPAGNAVWDNGAWVIQPPLPELGPSIEDRLEATETILRMILDAEFARQQGGSSV